MAKKPAAAKENTTRIVMKPKRASAVALEGPAGEGGCTEFSVGFALLTTDNNRQIAFGVTRGCIDPQTPLYVISFVLRDKIEGEFQDRVRLLVTVGPESNSKAQAIIDRGLRSSQRDFLEGPITTKAKKAPEGTTEATPKGQVLAKEVGKVLDKQ